MERCTLYRHAEHELRLLEGNSSDEMQQRVTKHILEMVDVFSKEGHSGFSANYAIGLLGKLLRFEPILPLTGEDDEWNEPYDEDGTQQNKRCSHVFRDASGRAYDIDGRAFVDEEGGAWGGSGSSVDITFPYTPKTERVPESEREKYMEAS